MSIEEQASQATEGTEQSASPEANEQKQQYTEGDLVAKKLIDENRKYREQNRNTRKELEEARQQLESFQEQKLQEEGKYKEASEFYKQKAQELEATLKDKTANYASTVVTSQVKARAAEMGCIDHEALVKLAPMGDLFDHIDDDYSVKPEAVKEMLELMQQKRPWLFKKPGPKIEAGTPSSEIPQAEQKPMSTLDLAKLALEQASKK